MHTAPRYAEVERAIRSVPGVAEASVVEVEDTGRGRLRIRLHPGEDADRVSWSVAATLRERFGIALDPDEIRPRMDEAASDTAPGTARDAPASDDPEAPGTDPDRTPDASPRADEDRPDATPSPGLNGHPDRGAPPTDAPDAEADGSDVIDVSRPAAVAGTGPDEAAGTAVADDLRVEDAATSSVLGRVEQRPVPGTVDGRRRAAIRDLTSRTGESDVEVTATLDFRGRLAHGRSTGVPTTRGLLRTIAEATVLALAELTGKRLRAQVDRVSLGGADPTTVTVVISVLSERGEELLLGASIVRDDVEHAVMRATLDALNRRVELDLTA